MRRTITINWAIGLQTMKTKTRRKIKSPQRSKGKHTKAREEARKLLNYAQLI
jgi:hypothetical protein